MLAESESRRRQSGRNPQNHLAENTINFEYSETFVRFPTLIWCRDQFSAMMRFNGV